MIIDKVLNNNAIVAHDDTGREIVAMGRGLAFGKKSGDRADRRQVEKTYYIADPSMQVKFRQLVISIPLPHMMLSERIINEARLQLGKPLSDSIYITLPDHISSALTRCQQGIVLHNPLLWDIRRFYPDEYAIGMLAKKMVLEETGVEFLDDEAAFIAMHFVNAQITEKISDVYAITYIMQEVCAIVRSCFDITFDEDSLDYYRFITHLKFFAQRILADLHYPDDDQEELIAAIRLKHAEAYDCAFKVSAFMYDKYHYQCGREELLYLTIHIARVTRGAKAGESDE